ncbi:hypothetical protein EDC01DRAFT_753547 [Geopyxis carbonaria]|nr:hypothetical protein EDC01DRAFT_753547 [Geopyxis carbonaria]
MSDDVGRKLLDEVKNVSFDKVLISIRKNRNRYNLLQIPTLDYIVHQLIPRQGNLQYIPAIEIVSASPACGKTHILYHVAALATLPRQLCGANVNGKGAAVVILDSDGRFNTARLFDVMEGHLKWCLRGFDQTAKNPQAIHAAIHDAMNHVHIYHPESSRQLMDILQCLPEYLFDFSKHHSRHRRLDAVLIDSTSAFYWQDKYMDLNLEALQSKQVYNIISDTLMDLSLRFGAFMIASNWALFRADNSAEAFGRLPTLPELSGNKPITDGQTNTRDLFRSHLPQSWNKLFSIKFMVEREQAPPYRPRISISEALDQKIKKQIGIATGKFFGWLDTASLRPEVQNRLRLEEAIFRYKIGADGIFFA